MKTSARFLVLALVAALPLGAALEARADPQVLERARKLLAESNPKQAYVELIAIQGRMAGVPEYDYLLGVAALDSSRFDDAVIAFERVLATNPGHAGAQMDLARAYFAMGSYDLAESALRKLKASNPPPAAQQAISQYLDAIEMRRRGIEPGWTGHAEVSLGYDSNLTGVPGDFGAASVQSFNLSVEPTGNAIKRSASYLEAIAGLEYAHPLGGGWSLFAGGGARGRAYHQESDFNIVAGDVRAGAAHNSGRQQWRLFGSYQDYSQEGAAPGDPMPTNDRRTGSGTADWRYGVDARNQLGATLQYSQVRFPTNSIDDFDQVYVAGSWAKTFEGKGVPLLYVTAFFTDDEAKNKFDDGVTDKSKNLAGARGYFQYAVSPKLQVFNALGFIYRKDKDAFARSTTVEKGKDKFGEFLLGLTWQFQERCAVRAQWSYTQNESNIDIYDFNRNEVSTAVRCDLF